jgi:predicted HNH restriction endonuclease
VTGNGQHQCASVDLKGDRFCTTCGGKLKLEGFERYTKRCSRCLKTAWREKERALRAALRTMFGGGCQTCGYDRCQAALHFHHRDGRPEGERGRRVRLQEVQAYPERFTLLCANCHIELHDEERVALCLQRQSENGIRGTGTAPAGC